MKSIVIIFIEVLFAILALLCYRKDSKKQFIILFSFMILYSLLLCFRNDSVPDFEGYYNGFLSIDKSKIYGFSLLTRYTELGYEYGYIWLMWIYKKIFGNTPIGYFAFISFLTSAVFIYSADQIITIMRCYNFKKNTFVLDNLRAKKKSKNLPLMFVVYSSYFGLCYEALAIRAGLSISFALLFISLFLKHKYWLSVIALFLACSFHRMGILSVFVLLIILFVPKFSKKIIFAVWLCMGFVIVFQINNIVYEYFRQMLDWIFVKFSFFNYQHYLSRMGYLYKVNRTTLWIWLIGGVFIWSLYDSNLMYRLVNVYFGCIVSHMFVTMIPGGNRISDYLRCVEVLLLHEYFTNNSRLSSSIKTVSIVFIILINSILSMRIWMSAIATWTFGF